MPFPLFLGEITSPPGSEWKPVSREALFISVDLPSLRVWLSSRLKKYNGDAGARIQAGLV